MSGWMQSSNFCAEQQLHGQPSQRMRRLPGRSKTYEKWLRVPATVHASPSEARRRSSSASGVRKLREYSAENCDADRTGNGA
jgi:hypothetical protein